MKTIAVFLIFAGLAYGQAPGKIITFNKVDTEHCKVVTVSGKPLLQSTYDGITVAISLPINRGNGDFSIFVAISQAGTQTVRVNPKDFFGSYPDQNHTRFTFYDKAAEAGAPNHPQTADGGMPAASTKVDPGSIRPGAMGSEGPPQGAGMPDAGMNGTAPKGSPNVSAVYLSKGKVKPGTGIAGWITLRNSSGGKLEIHPTDMLDEIDIPVNGVVFRF